jgi:hypothetical protein
MQINPNSSSAPIGPSDNAAKTVKRAATEVDSAAFSHVDELEKSMRDQEDTRAEVVQKAAELTNQPQWPPSETIRRIANLLAISMGQSAE